jgi:hypothetical protein
MNSSRDLRVEARRSRSQPQGAPRCYGSPNRSDGHHNRRPSSHDNPSLRLSGFGKRLLGQLQTLGGEFGTLSRRPAGIDHGSRLKGLVNAVHKLGNTRIAFATRSIFTRSYVGAQFAQMLLCLVHVSISTRAPPQSCYYVVQFLFVLVDFLTCHSMNLPLPSAHPPYCPRWFLMYA